MKQEIILFFNNQLRLTKVTLLVNNQKYILWQIVLAAWWVTMLERLTGVKMLEIVVCANLT